MKKVIILSGLLALLAGCADPQRWQSEAYRPNYTGDTWAPREDWAIGESRAQTDWNKVLEEQKSDPTNNHPEWAQ